MKQLFAGRNIDIPSFSAKMKNIAKELELPWGASNKIYNTRMAAELAKWAEEMGKGELFHIAVFRAFFAKGMNIADPAVLKELCRELGLDPDEAEETLTKGIYKKAVDDDWGYSRRLGIGAVPTFLAAGLTVEGAQPYEILERLIHQARGKRGA